MGTSRLGTSKEIVTSENKNKLREQVKSNPIKNTTATLEADMVIVTTGSESNLWVIACTSRYK